MKTLLRQRIAAGNRWATNESYTSVKTAIALDKHMFVKQYQRNYWYIQADVQPRGGEISGVSKQF
jgi:hypothetical protein